MALTSGVAKCFDRFVCNRLTPYVSDSLDLLQFAYRVGAARERGEERRENAVYRPHEDKRQHLCVAAGKICIDYRAE